MKKAFDKKKDIDTFKNQYKNGLINTEVISNIIQPYYKDKYPALKHYYDFWMPTASDAKEVMILFNLILILNTNAFLESYFGKEDFIFNGNRKYKNYIFEFDDLMIICSDKSEVVVDKVTPDVIKKLIRFNNGLAQMVLDYMITNGDPYEMSVISKMKNLNIIDNSNLLNFNMNHPNIVETPSI